MWVLYIKYSDDFINFEGFYEYREVTRIEWFKGHKVYVGVFHMKEGSEYSEVIVRSEKVVRDPDYPTFKEMDAIAFKKGDKIHAVEIIPGCEKRDYSLIVKE